MYWAKRPAHRGGRGEVAQDGHESGFIGPKANHLLKALPGVEWQRWLPQLEPVALGLGQVLYESGSTLSHVYFPTTALKSPISLAQHGYDALAFEKARATKCRIEQSQNVHAPQCQQPFGINVEFARRIDAAYQRTH